MKNKKRLYCLIAIITALGCFTLSGCEFMFKMLGKNSEYYLYSNKKVIKQHHKNWFGWTGNSDARSITSNATEDVADEFTDNMDYIASHEYFTGFEYFPKGLDEEGFAKYGDNIRGPLDATKYPILIAKTKSGLEYIFDIDCSWFEYSDIGNSENVTSMIKILNKDVDLAQGMINGLCNTHHIVGDDYFVLQENMVVTDKFPYPMFYYFDSRNTTLHTDPSRPDYYYWGVDYTDIEDEVFPILVTFTPEEYFDLLDNHHGNFSGASKKFEEAKESGFYPF